ncbi:MAG: alpha-L-fucosidase [Bacteroidetes bacterium GWF2_42_66]|nr:MAG: alpha-L-fucosidase [Bacteroidetes bacterium GWA2_42_15]OFY01062.1 MAG: alpha-L-fucosidase [Bacteroidetes bacterium GWE2_42_39]OFY41905.1 MAG: alpha-L-fucosidase [Bacteroidetes bacterium GWF2_42_66]HBL77916.1 alpha-L-fucosidase [Prolixibacteraceae bacterium]HCR90139.1 alpha-L-fucosidase [Prolixibacteraceae bacterium]
MKIHSLTKVSILIVVLFFCQPAHSQETANKAEREQWFMDAGFGMFIHWSFDSQLGAVISHSMAGASDDYLQRFVNELPKTFNPKKFDPEEWAILAKLAGMEYVVFTTKHHSGFCMWDTKTTGFNVMNTPFRRDATKEIFDAFRKQGIAIGIYFSPEDFHYLYENKIPVGRLQHPMHYPENNSGLMKLDKAQIKELLTNYGKIDVIFFDGPAEGLKEYAWQLQPDVVVTRGQMQTPEQNLPDKPIPGPWEACFTMGTDWQYKPTNDPHKSGTEIINMLIEIRAKGGNLLLNVGPKPDGEIQIEQEALLREVALWNMVNREGIHGIRAWEIIKEGNVWFTRAKNANTVYAFIPSGKEWKYGERKEFLFKTLKGNDQTRVSILGYASELVEYKQNFDAKIYSETTSMGLLVSAVNGHRLYTNNQWLNPVVMKIENVEYWAPLQQQEKKSTIDGAK